jgi:hypothetical protein
MRRARTEQTIQTAIFQHLACRARPASGGWRSRVEAAILKGLGARAGVPHVIAVKDGRTYALEIKSPNGRLTTAQKAAHAALRAAGAEIAVAFGIDEALAQLERWELLRGQTSGVQQ